MIAVDTNVIAYFLIPGDRTASAESLFETDSEWVAPDLWEHELLNVLCLYVRKGLMTRDQALSTLATASKLIRIVGAREVPRLAIELSESSGRSGYDCEFVAFAQRLGLKLVTADRQILSAFPDTAVSLDTYSPA